MNFNIPTLLTLMRLLLLPVLVWLLLSGYLWTALGLYVLGAVTDWLDGYIARRFNQVTAFGTFLDPIADKIYVAAVFVALVAAGHVEWLGAVMMIVILSREFMVSGLREFMGPHNVQFPVSKLAKWKTTLQMIATALLILAPLSGLIKMLGLSGLALASVLTVITGWDYLKTGLAHMKDMD